MEREWKDVRGYEGWYQVSNLGEVRSCQRTIRQMTKWGTVADRQMPGKPVNSTDNGNGYKIVGLRKNGERKNHYVHRLVAEAFLTKTGQTDVINHKDRDTANNCVSNLEWMTQKENVRLAEPYMRHAHRQLKQTATGEKHIYLRKNRYRLAIKGVIDRTFTTLEEAIAAKGVVLNGG